MKKQRSTVYGHFTTGTGLVLLTLLLVVVRVGLTQTIELLVPVPVGIRADQGESRLHGLVGQVSIPKAGSYRITAKEWLNSGDSQRNESFYLNLKDLSGRVVSPLDPNAGSEKVIPDLPGPPIYRWVDCGLFALLPGQYDIWMHHYAVIAAQYPQFLDGPIITPESVRIVDSLLVTFVPPAMPNRAPVARDDIANTQIDKPVSGQVLTNDSDPDGDSLRVTTIPLVAPAHGSLILNSDGSFTYTPDPGFAGADAFVYQVCDTRTPALCASATVYIQVFDNTPDNDRPVANDDIVETISGTPIDGNVVTNDIDPDNDPLIVTPTPLNPPDHGTLILNPDGSFTYTPDPGFTGADSFVYQVCDNGVPPLCDEGTVRITVHPDSSGADNHPPLATDDAFATRVNVTLEGSLALNDADPDGDELLYATSPLLAPRHGAVQIASDGSFRYVPEPGYTGPDYFIYQVCDNRTPALCDQATVYITVLSQPPPVNRAPVAQDDSLKTPFGTAGSGNLLTNDGDPDGDTLVLTTTPVTAPAHGSVTINPDGTFTYVPAAGYEGSDLFVYQVCDNRTPALCDQATVYITVLSQPPPANRAPVAQDDSLKTPFGTAGSGNLLTNDVDPDGDTLVLTTTPVTAPAHGVVVINPDGSFTYTPNAGYEGSDLFVYQVCDNRTPALCDQATVHITVLSQPPPVNRAPVAQDDSLKTPFGTAGSGNLLTNDGDPDGDTLVLTTTPVTAPAHGSVTINPDGTFTYVPAAGYEGSDQFVYQVCDSRTPALCDQATVYITVLSQPPPANRAPVAQDDSLKTPFGTAGSGNLLTNDVDPDGDPLVLITTPVTAPAHGSVTINPDGTFTYIPAAGYEGSDQFVYQVCDNRTPALCDQATVYITVLTQPPPVNRAPVARDDIANTQIDKPVSGQVLTNDSDPDGDSLRVTTIPLVAPAHGSLILNSDGSFTYTPDPGFAGADAFVYQVCDTRTPALCASATVYIQVFDNTPDNDRPVANDDIVETISGTPIDGNVVTNDIDPDNDPLIVTPTPLNPPDHGTLILNPDGTFTYTPDPGFTGADSFVYQVCDNGVPPLCDEGTVRITVHPDSSGADNHPPLAADDAFATRVNVTLEGSLALNDADPDGDELLYATSPLLAPLHGAVQIASDGSFRYVPESGYTGPDYFIYQVCDNRTPALCDQATVYITVLSQPPPVNRAPVAQDDSLKTPFGTAGSGNLLTNDVDPDGDTLVLTTTPVTAPAHGNVVINPDGSFTYTPNAGYEGSDLFVYQVCDYRTPALCDQATVYITVLTQPPPVNRAPVAVDDSVSTPAETPVSGNLLANDSEPDGDALTLNTTPIVPPSRGSVTINADGSFTYQPAPFFAGIDRFTYEICDDRTPALCAQATVTIAVASPPIPTPFIEALPVVVRAGNPVQVRVKVDGPVSDWDLWVYLANGEIDKTYGDDFVSRTNLDPYQWYRIEPDYLPLRMVTPGKEEIIKFEIRILDRYGNHAMAETGILLIEQNDLSLDRNTYQPDIQEPLQIKFRLSSSRTAQLDLYDIAGRHITLITQANFPSGWTTFTWNGRTEQGMMVGSGVYIVTLRSGEYHEYKKLMIVR